jgi:glycosyltransferase involved in cell wall biosynthesis
MVGSDWMRGELEINGIPGEKIEIVPPIPAAMGEVHSAPLSAAPEILFVGQVIRGKGVDLLLHALAKIPPPWHATVVGTGNHLQSCKKLAHELEIEERVHFAGWVAHQDLTPIYAKAALTVVPSRWPEPFGMVGIEAMARGRPVVGFAVGGIPDWLEDGVTGFLVPEADTGAMARAIERLLRNSELRTEFGEAAMQLVRKKYQPQSYLQQLMQILERVA